MKKAFLIIMLAVVMSFGVYMAVNSRNSDNNINTSTDTSTISKSNEPSKPELQSHRSYEIEVVSDSSDARPKQPTNFVYKIKNDRGEVLKNFAVTHEKIMHFILVRKDLQHFQHLHPDFNESTGEFTVSVTFPTDGPYRLFPDFTPAAEVGNQMALPVTLSYDLEVGDMSKYKSIDEQADTTAKQTVSGYEIEYVLPDGQDLKAENEITYQMHIRKNGTDVTDLEKYLGALGHSVILKKDSLDFIHTHATEDNEEHSGGHNTMTNENNQDENSSTGPMISFSTAFPEPGMYKIFTQFQHTGKVITSDYLISVQ